MNPAETLLKTLVESGEGTRKDGFPVGGVTYQLNQANDTITGTFTIPVTTTINATTGKIEISAKDFLDLPV